MGQFSWHAQDTNHPIYSTEGYQRPVTLVGPDGQQWTETAYEGYGEFGGKDFYELVAELNAPERCTGNLQHNRELGIDIVFGCNWVEDSKTIRFPNLVENPDAWEYDPHAIPQSHVNQGWYESDDEDELELEWYEDL